MQRGNLSERAVSFTHAMLKSMCDVLKNRACLCVRGRIIGAGRRLWGGGERGGLLCFCFALCVSGVDGRTCCTSNGAKWPHCAKRGVFTRFLIQGQLHLCLRKMHLNTRYNPLGQYGYCKQYPPDARLFGQHMRLSFASFTLQPPLRQTSPSP